MVSLRSIYFIKITRLYCNLLNLLIKNRQNSFFFEHLLLPLDEFTHDTPVFYLKATIDKVAAAEDREIVSAMAVASACGQGDCGCGCGSH